MWPVTDPFTRGLRERARAITIRTRADDGEDDRTLDIDLPHAGELGEADPFSVGELCALILAQAECDGASRVRLCYVTTRMFYTINAVDCEMVAAPWAANVDLVRGLARASRMADPGPATLLVRFADVAIEFDVGHEIVDDEPVLEIGGFTGEAWIEAEGAHTEASQTPQ